MMKVRELVEQLQKIALNPKGISDIDHLDLMIEAEKRECRSGWKQRLRYRIAPKLTPVGLYTF